MSLPPDPALLPPDPFKPFIIFSNRHEIRRIDLHRGDYSVLVPGLRNTIALDFHLNQSSLYWTDVVEDKIYRGKLLENGGAQPGCWGGWLEGKQGCRSGVSDSVVPHGDAAAEAHSPDSDSVLLSLCRS